MIGKNMDDDQKINLGLSDLPDSQLKGTRKRKLLELPLLNKSRELNCIEYEGDNIVEGDIMLTPPKEKGFWRNLFGTLGNVIVGDEYHDYRWPDGVVTYTTQGDVEQLVLNAIAHWEALTPFRFIHLSDLYNEDYVSFIASNQNASQVGRQGGKQVVKLERNTPAHCPGWAIHEIGHVIGLYHEHCRYDRDDYVIVNYENLRDPVFKEQFTPIVDSAYAVGDYDYDSQMHYPSNAFAKNGYETIFRLNGDSIDERCGLSYGDIEACMRLYPDLVWSAELEK